MNQKARNASISSLVYELLFCCYQKIAADEELWGHTDCFSHDYESAWEWTADGLVRMGMLAKTDNPMVFLPLKTLGQCANTNFDNFDHFDNYCYLMFAYRMVFDGPWRSPRVREFIFDRDDLFSENENGIEFEYDRFETKVLERWRHIDHRVIKPIGELTSPASRGVDTPRI